MCWGFFEVLLFSKYCHPAFLGVLCSIFLVSWSLGVWAEDTAGYCAGEGSSTELGPFPNLAWKAKPRQLLMARNGKNMHMGKLHPAGHFPGPTQLGYKRNSYVHLQGKPRKSLLLSTGLARKKCPKCQDPLQRGQNSKDWRLCFLLTLGRVSKFRPGYGVSLLNSKAKRTARPGSSLLSAKWSSLQGTSDLCWWRSIAGAKQKGRWSESAWCTTTGQQAEPSSRVLWCLRGDLAEHLGQRGMKQRAVVIPKQSTSPW